MHECRRREGMPGLFAPEVAACHTAQLVAHKWDEAVERLLIYVGRAPKD